MRYFIELAYKGWAYCGWQQQPNGISVQQTVTQALGVLLKEPQLNITGAGRTDAGVHASQTYAHFDCQTIADIPDMLYRLNAILPKDIVAREIIPVHAEAHARFDAKSRTYHYVIHRKKEVFLDDLSWYFPKKLALAPMNEAASILLQHHDFQCFSKVDTDVHSFNCQITEANWCQANNYLVFTITADRFLRNMVRAIVGTLIEIGSGKLPPQAMQAIISSKNRSEAGFSAPAHGLYLSKVTYDFINDSPANENSGVFLWANLAKQQYLPLTDLELPNKQKL